MPVIVVGADTEVGELLVTALHPHLREVRAFVTDADAADRIRAAGAKVAVGDVSDGSHLGGAALNVFCAILVAEAATDGRLRHFAADAGAVVTAWAEGLADAAVTRAIWVGPAEAPGIDTIEKAAREFAVVVPAANSDETVRRVVELEEARHLG